MNKKIIKDYYVISNEDFDEFLCTVNEFIENDDDGYHYELVGGMSVFKDEDNTVIYNQTVLGIKTYVLSK